MRTTKMFLLVFHCIALFTLSAFAQSVNDRVRLESTNLKGVPVHPEAGNNRYVRWANGTIGNVIEIDPETGWFKVDSEGQFGWITKNYLVVIPEEDPADASFAEELLVYTVGTWNLEHFGDGKSRGFPENTRGGPSFGPRTLEDYQLIAGIIKTQLFAKILVLNEINGISAGSSMEMDRLVGYLGPDWHYEIGQSGGAQRVAILYDSKSARKDYLEEIDVPLEKVDGADIFARDPLVAKFTLLDKNQLPQNDLIVVGLHLASGQDKVSNHNRAMQRLLAELHSLCDGTNFFGEKDILIMGDFNASRYDNKMENFWDGYDAVRFKFKTLAPADGEEYPGTRLAGVPLSLKSQIDFILASGAEKALLDQLVQFTAHVHTELVPTPASFEPFRKQVSDHLPVTVRIKVVPDDD